MDLLGLPFEISATDVQEERNPGESPEEMVSRLALAKAHRVGREYPACLVLGADTIVVVDEIILGKPRTMEEARSMLRLLGGRTHTVLTAIALVIEETGRSSFAVEATHVTFASLSDLEIDAYVRTGSPLDKAGAYGIQDDRGSLFISGIQGDFYNVMGLPVHRLYKLLQSDFSDIISDTA